MIFVGVDWAETHHDVCVLDEAGEAFARKRIPDTLEQHVGYDENLAWKHRADIAA